MIAVCPKCEKTFDVPAEYIGRSIKCVHCSGLMVASTKNTLLPAPEVIRVPANRILYNTPQCQLCSSPMVESKVVTGNASGIAAAILILLIGIGLCSIGTSGLIFGIPLIICALFMGGKRQKVLKCTNCGAVVNRG